MSTSPKVNLVAKANIGKATIEESHEFNVRPLPPPLPFIAYKDEGGTPRSFKGGGQISKRALMQATGVQAAIDDGVLNVPFKVTSFTINVIDSRGNFIPEISNSSEFSPRQKDLIRDIARGKQFYISNVKALDPAGKPVSIPQSMQVVVN
jgi:hypothetical protein